ncbi:hypothetical protein EN816_03095 [Mesorhizobium sp. M8A.F.Ca.ET.173.01.1.1]|nr:MAG: hypothetical protein EOS72_00335 [Mesorhizobium sp.]TGR39541.1 hypothetical protein EN842_40615 [bacterium M00.F.Ca.ET.199.01.1.1]TGV16238.1 hypothetical protein EN816_03095 [Mesorhizobium sp. M8A.F.Ca.ET.173.01.1.1]
MKQNPRRVAWVRFDATRFGVWAPSIFAGRVKALGGCATSLLALKRRSRYRLPMRKPAQDGS